MDMQTLLYPLGYIATFTFGIRFFLQWLVSEYQKKSIIPKNFWLISLIGNLSLVLHSLIQQQYHVCIAQACNAVIAWRNMNLMGPREEHFEFSSVVKIMLSTIFTVTLLFLSQYIFFESHHISWFKVPNQSLYPEKQNIPLYIHLLGFAGIILFASRFWLQWLLAEKNQKSFMGPLFWYLSISGNISSLLYFLYIFDPVNFMGPIIGLIPYMRNLMLLRNQKSSS